MPVPIYLDHNATTPVFPEVVEAMRACWSEPYLNPASQHSFGRAARRVLEDSRGRIAELLGANTTGPNPDRIIFTSSGTEANNLAIQGVLPNGGRRFSDAVAYQPAYLITSAIEHPSITSLSDHLSAIGYQIDRLGVDRNGVLREKELPTVLQPNTRMVAAMLANNETGVIQPIAELAAICNERHIPLHTDASQAAGKLPLNFHDLGAATMTIAAHKFGGPVGIGALVVRGDVDLAPQLFGGFQQAGTRPGTESVVLAVGLRTALELWHAHRQEWLMQLSNCRNRFEAALREARLTTCKLQVIGVDADRLPNTSNIAFVGLDRQALFIALDQAGVACSTGSACASGSSEPSPTHIAMGCDPGVISSALRFSFGMGTTLAEVEDGVDRILNVCNSLRQ
jgi:cysteine desulfurase